MDSLQHPRMHLIAPFSSADFLRLSKRVRAAIAAKGRSFEAKEREKRIGKGKYKLDYEAFFPISVNSETPEVKGSKDAVV